MHEVCRFREFRDTCLVHAALVSSAELTEALDEGETARPNPHLRCDFDSNLRLADSTPLPLYYGI